MKLGTLHADLNESRAEPEFDVIALIRLEDAEPDCEWPYDELEIVDIQVDAEHHDINLLLEDKRSSGENHALAFSEFASIIDDLAKNHSNYEVFVRDTKQVDEYEVSIDTPTIGVGVNADLKKFAVFAWFEEYESEL